MNVDFFFSFFFDLKAQFSVGWKRVSLWQSCERSPQSGSFQESQRVPGICPDFQLPAAGLCNPQTLMDQVQYELLINHDFLFKEVFEMHGQMKDYSSLIHKACSEKH